MVVMLKRGMIRILLITLIIIISLLNPNTEFYLRTTKAISVWNQTTVTDLINGTFDNLTIERDGLEAKLLLSNFSGVWTEKYPLEYPNARHNHLLSSLWNTDKVILFGGSNYTSQSGNNFFNDTWEYNLTNNNWVKIDTFNKPPISEFDNAMAYVWGTDNIVLFGGQKGGYYYDETWVFDYSDKSWTKKTPVAKSGARCRHRMASIWGTDKVLLYGGVNFTGGLTIFMDNGPKLLQKS